MLAFSNDYYGLIFRATQSVELFCAYNIWVNAKERAANEIKTKADIKAGKTPEEMWYEDGHSGVLDEDK